MGVCVRVSFCILPTVNFLHSAGCGCDTGELQHDSPGLIHELITVANSNPSQLLFFNSHVLLSY